MSGKSALSSTHFLARSRATHAIDCGGDKGDCADAVVNLGAQIFWWESTKQAHHNFNFEMTPEMDLFAGPLHSALMHPLWSFALFRVPPLSESSLK